MKLQAVIFDWAGTTVDYGSNAPVIVLQELFAKEGITLHQEEARHEMGLPKLQQIREICDLPRLVEEWQEKLGRPPEEADCLRIFEGFAAMQSEMLLEHSTVIPGVPEVVEKLRDRGFKIGSTTGYPRALLEVIRKQAAADGFAPDVTVTPDETHGIGRPAPWMAFENLRLLNIYPPQLCLKVGDTPSDMLEGRNAGMITVGVIESGNETAKGGAQYAREALAEA